MVCPFELGCANYNSAKCSVCQVINEMTQQKHGHGHYPAFRDKTWYAETIPYFKLKPLFKEVI